MGRLLDEDDVVDWLLKRTEMYDATGHFVDENVVKKNIESQIAKIPSAQPERKTGKWIYKNDLKQFFCSECGYPSLTYDDTYIYGMDLPNYCEDCGADMREGQDEQRN